MNANSYVLATALNALRHKQLGTLPPDTEFTPFNLSALRDTPKPLDRVKQGDAKTHRIPERLVEALTAP